MNVSSKGRNDKRSEYPKRSYPLGKGGEEQIEIPSCVEAYIPARGYKSLNLF